PQRQCAAQVRHQGPAADHDHAAADRVRRPGRHDPAAHRGIRLAPHHPHVARRAAARRALADGLLQGPLRRPGPGRRDHAHRPGLFGPLRRADERPDPDGRALHADRGLFAARLPPDDDGPGELHGAVHADAPLRVEAGRLRASVRVPGPVLMMTRALVGAVSAVAVLAWSGASPAQEPAALTALDYIEIQQLVAKYARAMDTCSNNGYDYADLYTPDGVFQPIIHGREVPPIQGREALAEVSGGGANNCEHVGWIEQGVHHVYVHHIVAPTPE